MPTTTPTLWKAPFTANAGSTAGNQAAPRTVGLANGNLLVVWADDANGPSRGVDIMGRIFDPFGNAIGAGPFQVNDAVSYNNETTPRIAALPDGGFVMAYEYDSGTPASGDDGLVVERYNSAGGPVTSRFITGATLQVGGNITVDANGNYIVAFTRGSDVRGVVYNYLSNNPHAEFSATQNGDDFNYFGGAAAFANGTVVTVSSESDSEGVGIPPIPFDYMTAEFKIVNPATGAVVVGPTHVAGSLESLGAHARGVAVLEGQQFVVVYASTTVELNMRIRTNGGANGVLGPEIVIVDTQSAVTFAGIVPLHDGGFFVGWVDHTDHALHGLRYDETGTEIGSAVMLATNLLDVSPHAAIGVTSDGRILATYRNDAGDISEVIFDPRDTVIYGAGTNDTIVSRLESTLVYGQGGNDRLLGMGGRDSLQGGAGNDTLDGGLGRDDLIGGTSNDTYVLSDATKTSNDPSISTTVFDTVFEAANAGIDTVQVQRVGKLGGYTLGNNIENGTVAGTADFALHGNDLANRLTGNAASNFFTGGGGNDTVNGAAGIDAASYATAPSAVVVNLASALAQNTGGAGIDLLTVIENLVGSGFRDTLTGYNGANLLAGGGDNDTLAGNGGTDTLDGGAGVDAADYRSEAAVSINLTSNALSGAAAGDMLIGIENLYGSNGGDDVLIGTVGTNALYGFAGIDRLNGGSDADFLNAGSGNDIMVGGDGTDGFAFANALNAATNVDVIIDFMVSQDRILLENLVFTNLAAGPLPSQAFQIGAANDSGDRILYNAASGRLFFDSDGSGAAAAIHFASLSTGLALTAANFLVI